MYLKFTIALAFTVASSTLFAADETSESIPAGVEVVSLEVFPAKIDLAHRFDYRQLLLTGLTAEGERVDLTRIAKIEASADVVAVSPMGQVRPKGDGQATLKISAAGKTAEVPVTVANSGAAYAVDYIRDVTPVLSKLGCNAGTCHGSEGEERF